MRTLLLDVDQQARTHARGLEGNGRLPKGFYDKHYPDTFVALAREGKAPRRWLTRRLTELGYR